MKQTIESAVAALFEHYEDTPQLRDFKEEIAMNLCERVRDLVQKGMEENEAVGRALAELGDVTEIADSIGRQKRKEAIGELCFPARPLERGHAAGYCAAGAALILGLIAAFLFSGRGTTIGRCVLVFLPFALASGCAFVFLGLTQETRTHFPVRGRRAALYAAAAGLLLTGALLGGALLFWETRELAPMLNALAQWKGERFAQTAAPSVLILLALILPGAALLCFLVLTQERRFKPWALEQIRRGAAQYDARFGALSAAIWVFAAALFVLLGVWIGWHPAWVVFLFAVAAEMLAVFFLGETRA